MNAYQFIQQHGVDKAREAITDHPRYANFVWIYNERITYGVSGFNGATNLSELKHLVESVDSVKSYGGIINAKHELILLQKHLNNTFGYVTIITSEKIENLEQAIADYESIGGEHV